MKKETVTIALPKGRLLKDSCVFLKKIGLDISVLQKETRKLILTSKKDGINYLIIRAIDIPIYVEYGAADLGVVGKDVLTEQSRQVIEPVDLKTGYCRIAVARPKSMKNNTFKSYIKVATKYPNITETYFRNQGIQVEIIKLYGSIELAPIVHLSDYIVDLVSTGKTLKENGMIEVETIMESTARLICNRASLALKFNRINNLIESFKKAV